MSRIPTAAKWGARITILLMVLSILTPIAVWSFLPLFLDVNQPFAYFAWLPAAMHPLTPLQRLLGFLLDCAPTVFVALIWYQATRLFRSYQALFLFTVENARRLHRIGWFLLIERLILIPYHMLMSLLFTWNNPPGHHVLQVSIDAIDVMLILTACLIILISWVMREGAKIAEENESFV